MKVTHDRLLNLMLKYNGGRPRAEVTNISDRDTSKRADCRLLHKRRYVLAQNGSGVGRQGVYSRHLAYLGRTVRILLHTDVESFNPSR